MNAPEGYEDLLGELPEGVGLIDGSGEAVDLVQAFVHNAAELQELAPTAIAAVKDEGLLWISYLKGGQKAGTDLNRDILHSAVKDTFGWQGVSLISVDGRWSAMRFRPGT